MSSISGNFYPEILVWMCNNANNPDKQEDVKWLQGEMSRVDPLIHIAYPLSAKYFLRKRGLPLRTISRAHALELTPQQKQTLDEIHESFLHWCERLKVAPVNIEYLLYVKTQDQEVLATLTVLQYLPEQPSIFHTNVRSFHVSHRAFASAVA